MDELAEALELDLIELRRRTLIEDGSVTATGQVLERITMKATLDRAVELIGDEPAFEDEAIWVACGWWPCFSANAGAYVKLNPDGTGTIVTGAQENGTGAVMAMPTLVAAELGMRPDDFFAPLPGHRRRALGHGLVRSQTTFNSVRPRRDRRGARPALDARSTSKRRARTSSSPAGAVRRGRREGGEICRPRRRRHLPRQGQGRSARGAAGARRGVRRAARQRVLAPQLIAHAAHVKVDRETGVVRVLRVAAVHDCGRILNRAAPTGRSTAAVMGIWPGAER